MKSERRVPRRSPLHPLTIDEFLALDLSSRGRAPTVTQGTRDADEMTHIERINGFGNPAHIPGLGVPH